MLIIDYYPIIAGAEVFAQKVAENLAYNPKNKVFVITARSNRSLPSFEIKSNVHIHRIVCPFFPHSFFLFSFLKALQFIKKHKIDLIHAHLAHYPGFSAVLAGLLTKKPVIITTQGGDLLDYAETGQYASLLRPILIYTLSHANLVHAVSRYTMRMAKTLGAKKMILIPNGVDIEQFHPRASNLDLKKKLGIKGEKIVLSVSRLTPKNGLSFLIRAAALINKKIPNVKFIIVGSGSEEKNLKKLTSQFKIDKNIIFTGYVPHEQIPEFMSIADVFLRPSVAEGFGIVFIEAMAAGIPVIATRVGGIIDIIQAGENGVLVEPKNSSQIADAIVKLLKNASLASELSRVGRKYVEQTYSWNIIFDKVKKMYAHFYRR